MGNSRQRKNLRVNSVLLTLIVCISPIFSVAGEWSTFEIVSSGKACRQTPSREFSCEYRVGNDLRFSIDGVGGEWTGITFLKSDFDGDFYAKFGLQHGCVIVRRGKKSWKKDAAEGPGSPSDYAFVSPKNGKVYREWGACKEGR
jgi:hypothetical protein